MTDLDDAAVQFDYSGLVGNSDLTANTGPAGCMSGATDPECPDVFDALGLGIGSFMTTSL